ncbi:MAG TPA: hypothetical protein VMH81_09495 [Bryobacteraceae bacterium]|nr:hypothetical protein [Bryobacteraceae bacterium]
MSFREKSAWISLLSVSAIYGFYFASLTRSGWHAPSSGFGGLLGTIVALVIVQTVMTVAVAIYKPKDAKAPRDERDRLIDLRSTRCAYAGLATGVAFAIFFAGFNPPILLNANALLFILVISEALRNTSQIVQYRRGA